MIRMDLILIIRIIPGLDEMYDLPVALAVAPNGGRRTTADHPALPTTPAALARCAARAAEAGAAMIHLHVRDARGRHVLDPAASAEADAAVRAAVGPEMVIQQTSESLGRYSPAEQRAAVMATRSEAVSLALRELVPDATEEAAFGDLIAALLARDCVPQIILYDAQDLSRLRGLLARGVLPVADVPVLVALGRYDGGTGARPRMLLPLLEAGLSAFGHWTVCAFGPQETRTVVAGALMGGHVRVGFENNLHLPDGSIAADNADLVAATAKALAALGLPLCDGPGLRAAWRAALQGRPGPGPAPAAPPGESGQQPLAMRNACG